MKKIVAVAVVTLIPFLALSGQIPDTEHIYVASVASVQVPPDMATLEITIYQTDLDAAKAKADVDSRSAKVIDIAKELGIKAADITASQIGINPDYDWEDKKKVYKGTNVKRNIKLVLRDLSKYTDLVQKLSEIPITSLGDVTMSSTRMEEHQDQALTKAIENAKAKANKIAKQFDMVLGDVYSISETEMHYDESRMYFAAYSVADTKSVFEPGTIEIHARIYVVFKLKAKK